MCTLYSRLAMLTARGAAHAQRREREARAVVWYMRLASAGGWAAARTVGEAEDWQPGLRPPPRHFAFFLMRPLFGARWRAVGSGSQSEGTLPSSAFIDCSTCANCAREPNFFLA